MRNLSKAIETEQARGLKGLHVDFFAHHKSDHFPGGQYYRGYIRDEGEHDLASLSYHVDRTGKHAHVAWLGDYGSDTPQGKLGRHLGPLLRRTFLERHPRLEKISAHRVAVHNYDTGEITSGLKHDTYKEYHLQGGGVKTFPLVDPQELPGNVQGSFNAGHSGPHFRPEGNRSPLRPVKTMERLGRTIDGGHVYRLSDGKRTYHIAVSDRAHEPLTRQLRELGLEPQDRFEMSKGLAKGRVPGFPKGKVRASDGREYSLTEHNFSGTPWATHDLLHREDTEGEFELERRLGAMHVYSGDRDWHRDRLAWMQMNYQPFTAHPDPTSKHKELGYSRYHLTDRSGKRYLGRVELAHDRKMHSGGEEYNAPYVQALHLTGMPVPSGRERTIERAADAVTSAFRRQWPNPDRGPKELYQYVDSAHPTTRKLGEINPASNHPMAALTEPYTRMRMQEEGERWLANHQAERRTRKASAKDASGMSQEELEQLAMGGGYLGKAIERGSARRMGGAKLDWEDSFESDDHFPGGTHHSVNIVSPEGEHLARASYDIDSTGKHAYVSWIGGRAASQGTLGRHLPHILRQMKEKHPGLETVHAHRVPFYSHEGGETRTISGLKEEIFKEYRLGARRGVKTFPIGYSGDYSPHGGGFASQEGVLRFQPTGYNGGSSFPVEKVERIARGAEGSHLYRVHGTRGEVNYTTADLHEHPKNERLLKRHGIPLEDKPDWSAYETMKAVELPEAAGRKGLRWRHYTPLPSHHYPTGTFHQADLLDNTGETLAEAHYHLTSDRKHAYIDWLGGTNEDQGVVGRHLRGALRALKAKHPKLETVEAYRASMRDGHGEVISGQHQDSFKRYDLKAGKITEMPITYPGKHGEVVSDGELRERARGGLEYQGLSHATGGDVTFRVTGAKRLGRMSEGEHVYQLRGERGKRYHVAIHDFAHPRFLQTLQAHQLPVSDDFSWAEVKKAVELPRAQAMGGVRVGWVASAPSSHFPGGKHHRAVIVSDGGEHLADLQYHTTPDETHAYINWLGGAGAHYGSNQGIVGRHLKGAMRQLVQHHPKLESLEAHRAPIYAQGEQGMERRSGLREHTFRRYDLKAGKITEMPITSEGEHGPELSHVRLLPGEDGLYLDGFDRRSGGSVSWPVAQAVRRGRKTDGGHVYQVHGPQGGHFSLSVKDGAHEGFLKTLDEWGVPHHDDFSWKLKKGMLTSQERRELPRGEFALPGERKYPVNDRGHAQAALGRAKMMLQRGRISREQYAQIRRRALAVLGRSSSDEEEE